MRLAVSAGGGGSAQRSTLALLARDEAAPTVRLAAGRNDRGHQAAALMERALRDTRPALLVSFVYLRPWLSLRARGAYHYRDWVLDSGAFSAHNMGAEINLQEYIDTAKRLRDSEADLTEVFALDVIGDWRASLANTEAMWRQGVEAIPCYHAGEPEDVLRGLARDYPKIAIGGVANLRFGRKKLDWAEQCFARVWPKRVHGFAFGSESALMRLPFHSVDASNWEAGPCKFGNWKAFGGLSVRGSKQNLRAEVDWYLALERRGRARWAKTWAESFSDAAPTVRLACTGSGQGEVNGSLAHPDIAVDGTPGRRLFDQQTHARRQEAGHDGRDSGGGAPQRGDGLDGGGGRGRARARRE